MYNIVMLILNYLTGCGGGIGIRVGLKIQWMQIHESSSLSHSTILRFASQSFG